MWKKLAVIGMVFCMTTASVVQGAALSPAADKTAAETDATATTATTAAEAATAAEATTADPAAEAVSEKENGAAEAATAAEATTADPAAEYTAEPATSTGMDAISFNSIPYWEKNSPAMASIISYVESVTDRFSRDYIPPEKRIAAFDSDGTLIGELFPTYFDKCLLMYRLLHDSTYEEADPEDRKFAEELETALLNHKPEPASPKSTAQMTTESFKGFTVEEYRAYVREFMEHPAIGFEGMTYGEAFYKPMTALVEYLAKHDFKVFICSGTERSILRELTEGTLDEWIPPYQVIGSTISLTATAQGETQGRDYTYAPDDQVLLEGNMTFKNLKMNKVVSIIDEIGAVPILAFGNSTGDFAMAQYVVQNGGKAYMLLCDDTERDYGNLDTAEKFAEKCKKLGFETVSMKNEFSTIYGDAVIKTDYLQKTTEEEQKEAPDQKADQTKDQEAPDPKTDQTKNQETPDQKADQTKDQKTPDQKTDQTKDQKTSDQKKDQEEGQNIQDQKTDQTKATDKETDNRTEQQIIEEQENSDEQMPGMDDPLKLKDGQEPEEEEILKPAA
ncbi:MAG: haloacid dehalogenase-like hydrolase [Lachnospiraceae bacterium]|nr:haloacid dehalogenase-like hydrolase [Lachnospiraceae bacterium]